MSSDCRQSEDTVPSPVFKLSPLASVAATREVLEAHGLSTKKALGQHFLISDGVVRRICELARLCPDDVVLEVGPGIGTLTVALLQKAGMVVSVERDRALPAVLAQTCADYENRFALISKDALALTEEDLLEALANLDARRPHQKPHHSEHSPRCSDRFPHHSNYSPQHSKRSEESGREHAGQKGCHPMPLRTTDRQIMQPRLPNKFVANLPYAVAATLVLDFFERFESLESATVMVQKEVADRMCAKPGTKTYGAYTVKLSLFAQAAERFTVGPQNFFPPPQVESAAARLDRRHPLDKAGKPLTPEARRASCIMADAAFANRRKTILNSCKAYFASQGNDGEIVAKALPRIFAEADIDPKRRGESFSTSDFISLGQAALPFLNH